MLVPPYLNPLSRGDEVGGKRKKWMDRIVLGFFLRATSNEQLATKYSEGKNHV